MNAIPNAAVPATIAQYLEQLQSELKAADPALVLDAAVIADVPGVVGTTEP